MSGKCVITIGNFDGVHIGHAALVRRARAMADGLAGGRGRVVVLMFDPHPLTRLRPAEAPPMLSVFERRADWLNGLGADEVVRLEPTDEVLALTPEQFVDRWVAPRGAAAVVEGEDFRFGRGRAGDVAALAELGKKRGFGVEIVGPVEVAMSDHTVSTASSTMARWLVGQGRVRDAAAVLGRPYELEGVVVKGDQRGRQIGFPTANLETACLFPADGVYAGTAELLPNPAGEGAVSDGGVHSGLPDASAARMIAAISIGTKPTFGGSPTPVVEAFLMECRAGALGGAALPAGLPEYGWRLRLRFVGWVREQLKFDSVRPLVEQMGRDCERAARMVREFSGSSGARLPTASPGGEVAACR